MKTFESAFLKCDCASWNFLIILFVSTANLLGQSVIGTISRPNLRPYAVAVYEAGNKVFVADDATGNLFTYDGNTNAEINAALVGRLVSAMVVHEASAKLYALSFDLKKIAVVNANTGALVKYLPGKYPTGFTFLGSGDLALDEDIGKLYAFVSGDTVAQIDIATDAITPIALNKADFVFNTVMAVNPATHELFITRAQQTGAASFVEIINGRTLQKTSAPGIGGSALGIGVNWTANKVYVSTGGGIGVPFRVLHRNTNTVQSIAADNDATLFFFDPATNQVFTSSEVNAFVTIIDGATDAFLNFPMKSATLASAIRRRNGHIYFASTNFIGVLDRESQMLEMISVNNPHAGGIIVQGLALNQTTGRVYALNDSRLNFVTVIQDTDDFIRPPIYLGGGTQGLKVLDPVSKEVVDRWVRGGGSIAMAIRPGGGRIYASAGFSLYVYAGAGSSSLLHTINIGTGLAVPVITPDGKKIYATADAASKVVAIDLEANRVAAEIPVSAVPWGAAMAPDGSKVYVGTRGFENEIAIIDIATNTVRKKIALKMPPAMRATGPWGLALNPSGTKLYVANYLTNAVSVINTITETFVKDISVGEQPRWIAITPDGKQVYVSNAMGGTVSIIDSGADAVIKTVTVGANPQSLGAFPDGSAVYVVNQNTASPSSLAVINTSDFSVVTTPLSEGNISSLAIADPTAKIAGRVTRGNTAVEGASVRALQSGAPRGTATTNAGGDYSIFNLRPGVYDIEVNAANTPPQNAPGKIAGRGQTTVVHFNLDATEVAAPAVTPRQFRLEQNYPNPFNRATARPGGSTATTIHYEIPARMHVRLTILNLLGHEMAILVDQEKSAGPHRAVWEPREVAGGIYLYRLQAGNAVETKKLVLLR